MLNVENLDVRREFRELPETYTIFIIEKDFYNHGEPVYLIERINITTGKPFEDEAHIVYVNGEYRGDSVIGKLMHDFNCTKAHPLLDYPRQDRKERSEGLRSGAIYP